MSDLNRPWLNSHEAAEYLRVSNGALRNMIYRGEIAVYKIGKRSRFLKKELDEYLSCRRYRNGKLEGVKNGNQNDWEWKV